MSLEVNQKRFVSAEQRIVSSDPKVSERREKAIKQRLEAENWVVEWLKANQKDDWLAGASGLKIPDVEVKGLVREIESAFSGSMRRHAINFLARELERGIAAHGWLSWVPGRVIALRLPSPPITADSFSDLVTADALQAAYLEGWAQLGARGTTREVRVGDILLSAVMFAGVLNAGKLLGFAANFETGFRHWNDQSWVEWQTESGAWERVVVDQITAALILRWFSQGKPLDPKIEWMPTLVIRAMEDVAPLRRAGVRSLSRLLIVMRVVWAIDLPPFLYGWSCGRTSSAVLAGPTFFRVLSRQRRKTEDSIALPSIPISETVEKNSVSGEVTDLPVPSETAPWWRQLRKLIAKGKTPLHGPEAVRRINGFVGRQAPRSIPALLGEWLIEQLKPVKESGKGSRVSSARTYLHRIDRRLDDMLAGRSPVDHPIQWEDDLFEIVEGIPGSYRRQVKIALVSFHSFMERRQWVPPLSIDLGRDAESQVDANLLTELEFERVRKYLSEHDRLFPGAATEVAAILARRVCLRRNELRYMRLSDWCGTARPFLFVRPNENRQLKKNHGRRTVDLRAACTANEFTRLQAYREELDATVRQYGWDREEIALFPIRPSPNEPQSETQLIDPIVSAMALVTGDNALRFHHLRHTGINVNVLESVATLNPEVLSIMADSTTDNERSDFLVSQVGHALPLRPRIWAVAQSAGHATPETTLGSYFHFCDWLLGQFASARLPELNDISRAAIASCTVANLRVRRHRYGEDRVTFCRMLLDLVDPTSYVIPHADQFEDFDTQIVTPQTPGVLHVPNPIEVLGALQAGRRQTSGHYAGRLDPFLLIRMQQRAAILYEVPLRGESKNRPADAVGGVMISRRWETPPLPQVNDERLQILRLGQGMWQHAHAFPDIAKEWLSAYIAGRYPRGNAMQIDDPDNGRAWLEFLTGAIDGYCSVNNSHQSNLEVVVSVRPSKRSRHAPDAQLDKWRSALNGLRVRWATPPLNRQLSHGIGLWGTSDIWIEAPPSASELSQKGWKRTGSSALEAAAYFLFLTLPE